MGVPRMEAYSACRLVDAQREALHVGVVAQVPTEQLVKDIVSTQRRLGVSLLDVPRDGCVIDTKRIEAREGDGRDDNRWLHGCRQGLHPMALAGAARWLDARWR